MVVTPPYTNCTPVSATVRHTTLQGRNEWPQTEILVKLSNNPRLSPCTSGKAENPPRRVITMPYGAPGCGSADWINRPWATWEVGAPRLYGEANNLTNRVAWPFHFSYYVRFTAESGHLHRNARCRLWAISGYSDFVGATFEPFWPSRRRSGFEIAHG